METTFAPNAAMELIKVRSWVARAHPPTPQLLHVRYTTMRCVPPLTGVACGLILDIHRPRCQGGVTLVSRCPPTHKGPMQTLVHTTPPFVKLPSSLPGAWAFTTTTTNATTKTNGQTFRRAWKPPLPQCCHRMGQGTHMRHYSTTTYTTAAPR